MTKKSPPNLISNMLTTYLKHMLNLISEQIFAVKQLDDYSVSNLNHKIYF